MKIHEYQAKSMFKDYGIPITDGEVASTAEEAQAIADKIGGAVVVKAQVHVGGRGKAGGVKVVENTADVKDVAAKILDLTIKELPVRKVLVTSAAEIKTEVYLSILVDRGARTVVYIGCADGGVEIEETAKTDPDKIKRFEVSMAKLKGLTAADVQDFAKELFSEQKHVDQAADIILKIGKLFLERDCELVEINPLIIDGNDNVLALDAKVLFDDNALMRQADNETMRDMDAEDQDELDASSQGLSFVRLEGQVGCMVNGAGLAMATMDIINLKGGKPANFLDVGGSSNPKKVVAAFKTILKDPNVKTILINIFGGITRCDDIAQGILSSMEEFDVPVPIVIRLAGTNEEQGRKMLEGTKLIPAETLATGAEQCVEVMGA